MATNVGHASARTSRAGSRTGSNRSLAIDGLPEAAGGVEMKKRGGRFSEASLHAKAASVHLGIVIPAAAAAGGVGSLLPSAAAPSARAERARAATASPASPASPESATTVAPAPPASPESAEQVAVEVKQGS